MTKATEEALALSEKVVDSTIKIGGLSVLGLEIPKSVEEVGVLGAAFSIMKIGSYFRDFQFESSFRKFTSELDSLTFEQKQNFFNKHSKRDVEEFGEQALLLLNKIEMPLAAKMLGKAYYLLVLEDLTEDEYINYCHIIKNLNLYLFKKIEEAYGNNVLMEFTGGVYALLSSFGLVDEVPTGMFPSDKVSATEYRKSEFGQLFYNRIVQPFSGNR